MKFESFKGNEALPHVNGDFGVCSNGGLTPGVPLEFQVENGLLLMCGRNVGIPLQTKQETRPSSREEVWKTGLFLSYGVKLSVPLTWGWVSCRTS